MLDHILNLKRLVKIQSVFTRDVKIFHKMSTHVIGLKAGTIEL